MFGCGDYASVHWLADFRNHIGGLWSSQLVWKHVSHGNDDREANAGDRSVAEGKCRKEKKQ